MSSRTVVQHSEELDRAIKWLGARLEEDPNQPIALLVSEAGPRFNLSPSDQDTLVRLARQVRSRGAARSRGRAPEDAR